MENLYLRLFCKLYGHVYEYDLTAEFRIAMCNTCDRVFCD